MDRRVTVLIVDDHKVVRQGIRAFLEAQAEFEVLEEAESGAAAVELAGRHVPDVVLMDLIMPVMDGVEATRQVKDVSPVSFPDVPALLGGEEKPVTGAHIGPLTQVRLYL